MKSFIAVSVALLAASAAAMPARRDTDTVTFALSNDQTGHQASATIWADNTVSLFNSLFANSAIDSNGQILASSVQLTAFPQHVTCNINDAEGQVFASLSDTKTYFDLDGNPAAAIPVDVSSFSINCDVY
ncbi:hypothetical protein BGW36DRAFT_465683 [Talaromyces proteolyticus]|uniref:Uncharacterized protein n=1 Tax=Talaromyces proteolyticus TaxID=1131652 RepID=A0AAD4KLH8_9EURO|nr:uncharacterized protein BGW36DRAFT_465683 [Talaromyces proteolyticus]KAH8690841.1 hypothetical protein BGW36DRAFT_465683 [Talaromyces proteolyticus]